MYYIRYIMYSILNRGPESATPCVQSFLRDLTQQCRKMGMKPPEAPPPIIWCAGTLKT